MNIQILYIKKMCFLLLFFENKKSQKPPVVPACPAAEFRALRGYFWKTESCTALKARQREM